MSIAEARVTSPRRWVVGFPFERLVLATAAVLVVAAGMAVLAWAVLATGVIPKPPPRNPFGLSLREVAPSTTGIGGLILAIQAQFYAALTMAVQAMKSENAAITSLATVGFLYGIFHAAGPGHGKGVITAYIVAGKRSLGRGLALSVAAALLQACVAVALVGVMTIMLKATAASINVTARAIELTSFAAIAAVGLFLVWGKAGQLAGFVSAVRIGQAPLVEKAELPPPSDLSRLRHWRELIGVVLAAGVRPCSGAIILLVFALSQGLFLAGVVGAFAMAVGTAMTTGTLASLAVFAKAALLRLTAVHGFTGLLFVAAVELVAAAFVLMLGVMLVTGLWSGGLPSMLD